MKLPDNNQRHVARFWSQVEVRDPEECWPWLGGRRKGTYGGFKVDGISFLAHRLAFFLHYGWWPRVVCHTCDLPACVNPGHLVGGDQAANMAEAAKRSRMNSKLSLDQVREVRRSSEPGVALASHFGVSTALISMIRRGKARVHAATR